MSGWYSMCWWLGINVDFRCQHQSQPLIIIRIYIYFIDIYHILCSTMAILTKLKHASTVWALCSASTCIVEYLFLVVVIGKWLWLVDAACHGDCLWKSPMVTIWSTLWVYVLGWPWYIDMTISPVWRWFRLTGDFSRIWFDIIIDFLLGFSVLVSVDCISVSIGLESTNWLLNCSQDLLVDLSGSLCRYLSVGI